MKTLVRIAIASSIAFLAFGGVATTAHPSGFHVTVAYAPDSADDGGTVGNGPDGAGSLPVPQASSHP